MQNYYIITALRCPDRDKSVMLSTQNIALYYSVFIEAPNWDKLKQHIKSVKGTSVQCRNLKTVKMNVRSTLRIGDSVEFKGTVIGVVEFSDGLYHKYLKIKVWQLPKTFIYVSINNYDELRLRQKVLKK